MKRTLYVDGSNLFGGMSALLPVGSYMDFTSLLAVVEQDIALSKVKFYATYMKFDATSPTAHQLNAKAQVEFLNSAKKSTKVEFHKGYFSGSNKEKGIDMRLGLDLYIDGRENDYDEAILMSGDADFNYAVDKVNGIGKPVHMAAFASRFPFGMVNRAAQKLVYDYNGYFVENTMPFMKRKPYNLQIQEISSRVKIIAI